jgi:hypothetical protein
MRKMSFQKIVSKLKGKDKFETAENFSIVGIVFGALVLTSGIGLTIVTPKGLPAILAMLGSLIAFLSTVALVFVWLAREFFGE